MSNASCRATIFRTVSPETVASLPFRDELSAMMSNSCVCYLEYNVACHGICRQAARRAIGELESLRASWSGLDVYGHSNPPRQREIRLCRHRRISALATAHLSSIRNATMTRIVIAKVSDHAWSDLAVEQAILGADTELVPLLCADSEELLISVCRAADVVLTDLAPLTRRVISELHRCQLISIAGTGYSNVDMEAAKEANISVCAIEEYCTDEVADHVMLMTLTLCRRLLEYHYQVQEKKLWLPASLTGLSRLRDMTMGIVGFGRIGRAVAERARGFGMTILAHDHQVGTNATHDAGVRFCDLPTLLANSDVISLNCSMSPENRNLIGADAFEQMSRQPILINCARGELIDEDALVAALDRGQISGAGLDVLCGEPPDLDNSRFMGRSNVIVTPHVAFNSDMSVSASRGISARNIRNFLDGRHENVRQYVHQVLN